MYKTVIHLILVSILLTGGHSSAQWAGCPDVAQFVKEIDPATKTWKDLYRFFKTYPGCDDGVYGEGYSDFVSQSLSKYWNRLNELSSLIKKDPSFEDFVLNHINATADPQDIKAMLNNARTKCSVNHKAICTKIENAALSVLQ